MTPLLGSSSSWDFYTYMLQVCIHPTEDNKCIQKNKVRVILYSSLNEGFWACSSEAFYKISKVLPFRIIKGDICVLGGASRVLSFQYNAMFPKLIRKEEGKNVMLQENRTLHSNGCL